MRRSRCLFVLFLLGAPPIHADEHWCLVHRDGRIEAVQGELTLPAADLGELEALWHWSMDAAPRRLEPDELVGFEATRAREHLDVHVVLPEPEEESGDTHTEATPPKDLGTVVAAPFQMWLEVPEPLLPTWPVPPSGNLRLPWDGSPGWRLRRLDEGRGTWWTNLRPRQDQVILHPLAATDVRVEITDGDGEPIPGARLRAFQSTPSRSRANAHFALYLGDDHGAATITSLPDAEALTLLASAPGFVAGTVRGSPGSLPPELRLERGTTLHGRFVDPDRTPLAGVEVRLEAWLRGAFRAYVGREVESGEDGTWSLAAVPAGAAILEARRSGLATWRSELEVEATADGIDLGDVVLEPSAELDVLVLGEADVPIAGAELRARPGEPATTGDGGRATLRGLHAAASVELSVDARGHLPLTRILTPPHPPEVEIRLDGALQVRGRLLEPGGEPATDGLARAADGPRSLHQPLEGDGSFRLELEPGRPHTLTLSSSSTRELRLELEPGAAGEVRDLGDLVAPPSLAVRGRLVAGDGRAVAGAQVWSPRPSARHEATAWYFGDLLTTTSDGEGTFLLRGLAPRSARLRIDAAGFARREIEVQPRAEGNKGSAPEDGVTELGEIELRPGTAMTVLLADAEPGTVARADLGNRWLEMDMLTAPFADGVATFEQVPPGKVTVSALADGQLLCEETIQVAADVPELEVICRRNALRVQGWVRVGGRVSGPGRLGWLPPAPEAPSLIHRASTAGGLGTHRVYGGGRPQVDVEVAADGYFATDALRPGAWTVLWYPDDGGASASRRIELAEPAGEAAELELLVELPASTIEGWVVDDGGAVAGARVRELGTGTVAFTDADGRFRLLGLEPGEHWLRAELGGKRGGAVAVTLEAASAPDPVQLGLDGAEPVVVEARVLDGGEGLPGAFVFLETAGGRSRILTADTHGRVSSPIDPPHPAALRFAAFAGNRWFLGPWIDWRDARRERVDLEMPPAGSLVLRFDPQLAAPKIVSAHGWEISRMSARLGLAPAAGDGRWRLDGLPAGIYELVFAGAARRVVLGEGEELELEP